MATAPQKKEEVKSPLVLTNDEQALASRIASGTSEWQTINERDVEDFSLSEDPFKLPPAAQKLQDEKKFKFRWFSRNPQRVDEVKNFAKVKRWWVVNRVQPVGGVFEDCIDSSTGGIHCLDQLLFFKPWWLWEAEQKLERTLAEAQMGGIEQMDKTDAKGSGLQWAAGRRHVKGKSMGRQEVHGSDIQFAGEQEADEALGRESSGVSESELSTINAKIEE